MIYCFDIDGTVSAKPDVFAQMMKSLKDCGHEVYPLTGTVIGVNQTGEDYRIAQLASYGLVKGVHYTDVVVCVGNSVESVGTLKGQFCRDHAVSFMVEDSGFYAKAIETISPGTLCLRMPNLA